jgi:hypothetical protein
MTDAHTRDLIERLRAELRARDFVRLSDGDALRLATAHPESVHACAMEGLDHDEADAALDAMLFEERVPTEVAIEIYRRFVAERGGEGA